MSSLERFRKWADESFSRNNGSIDTNSVLVIGLGRFGTSLAAELGELGVEVMAVDVSQDLVDEWADRIAHVRVADTTSASALTQLGALDFDAVVVAIGSDIEASVLTTAALADLGIGNIWAKAITSEHGRILERVGAHHVVFPEKQMGERVAHMVSGEVVDYFELDEGFVLAELKAPKSLIGVRLADSHLRDRFRVTVVCVKPEGGSFTYATADTVVGPGDLVVVAGTVEDARRFTEHAAG